MSGVEWAIAALVCALGGLLQGTIGFGFALLIAPVLAVIDAGLVPGAPIMLAIALGGASMVRNRAGMYRSSWALAVVGSIPGTVLGGLAVIALPERGLAIVLGISVLGSVALSASGIDARPTRRTLFAAGAVSGFTGTSTSIGGPPVALLYQHAPGDEIRGVLAGYFFITGAMSAAMLGASGKLDLHQLRVAAALVAPMLVGLVSAKPLHPLVDKGYTRPAVLVVCTGAAIVLLVRQF